MRMESDADSNANTANETETVGAGRADAHPPTVPPTIRLEVTDHIDRVEAAAWDALVSPRHPFVSHGFLEALEHGDCLEEQGWYPQHLMAFDGESLVGAMPLYLRDNSYGEFVFDWSWAEAFERAGGRYYPKLVSAVPFSPVAGPRLLADNPAVQRALLEAGQRLAEDNELSSLHQLFLTEAESAASESLGQMTRLGVQYQWFNQDYTDFDDFLARLTAKRRKELRRERRKAAESGLTLMTVTGQQITPAMWDAYYGFYCATFYRKWGSPRLTRAFFDRLVEHLGDRVMLELAFEGDRPVAGAFLVVGSDTLFGRHWGSEANYKFLHFELCYYRPIETCIRLGLGRFDAGVQGEHKLGRGFVPVLTRSSHFVPNNGFARAVSDFLKRERVSVRNYFAQCRNSTAFNESALADALAASDSWR